MRASSLDRRILIQKPIKERDQFNNLVITGWTNFISVRASKKDVSDSEKIAAQEVGAEITTRFQVRWNSLIANVDAKDQLICEGKTYQIVGIKELGRRLGREITATARIDT